MYQYKAKLLKWVDGDTLLVEIDLGFYCTREERIRLARINAPELKSEIPFQRRKAKHAKMVGKKFCPENSKIEVHTTKTSRDMYARYLAEVYYAGKNISDYLIEQSVVTVFSNE